MNAKTIMKYCDAPTDHFWNTYPTFRSDYGNHAYVDNGSKVLGVAHLDTVDDLYKDKRQPAQHVGNRVISTSLDDRLGVYVLLEELPQRGIVLDWLLTENEERCRSTADDFRTDKQYNWIIEFDRAGTDVVMYQYHDEEWRVPLAAIGMELGHGSYSDISDLAHLQATAFNWGIGYVKPHTPQCQAHLGIVTRQVNRFVQFYEQHKSLAMPWEGLSESEYEMLDEIEEAERAWLDGEELTERQIRLLDLLGWEVTTDDGIGSTVRETYRTENITWL